MKKIKVVKKANILWLISLFLISCSSPKKENTTVKDENKALSEFDFNAQQRADWRSLSGDWKDGPFKAILKNNNFKQDCIECGSILLKVHFQVDSQGDITEIILVDSEIDCSRKSEDERKKLETLILESFKTLKFPVSLRNILIEASIGNPTKC